MSEDWRDGFLFVGNDLALDFLNTRPVVEGSAVELLPDAAAAARWIGAAALTAPSASKRLARIWANSSSYVGIEKLRDFRERWRDQVLRMEAGRSPSSGFVAEVNRLLADHPYLEELGDEEGVLAIKKRFAPESVLDLFAPLAHSVAQLLVSADLSRLRKCSNCVLHFHDTSKKGNRQWCSMNFCGNRFKVAAYTARKRALADQS